MLRNILSDMEEKLAGYIFAKKYSILNYSEPFVFMMKRMNMASLS